MWAMIKVKAQLPSPSNRRLFRLRRPAELAIRNRERTDEQALQSLWRRRDDRDRRIVWLAVRTGGANSTTGRRTSSAGATSGANGTTGATGSQAQRARFGARL